MPTHDFSRPIDLEQLPASVILASAQDPARAIPGAPPLFGQEIIPHFMTSTGYVGSAARAYPIEDEATRNSVENAERMRTETGIMEPLEARMRATALLKWHLVPEDEKSPKQIKLTQMLTRVLERTPRFVEYRRCLMDALWFGKYANVNTFGTTQVGGKYRTVISDWSPRHGDKLMFRYSDGTYKYKAGQLGIRVHAGFFANAPTRFQELDDYQRRKKVEPTQYGLVYWFDDYERETIVVHRHMVEDGPWHEPRMMGRVMGVGIRDRVYWTWYAMQALLQDLLTYVNRAALGVRLWRYPSGNPQWKDAVENAAKSAIANGVADILFPVEPNEYASMYGVEQIEPGISGAQMIRELIENFFLKKIKKYILGQLLTTEAESTGMGGGVAAAHLATFSDIVKYDAYNLQETITEQLVKKLQKENARSSMGVHVRFVLDTDEPDVQKRLSAIQSAYSMDIPIKVEDVYMLTGLTIPEPGDEVVTVSAQQLRQQKQSLAINAEMQEKQMRLQQQMQMETMQQQAAMQQMMGGGQPGQPQQGQPQQQEAAPQEKAALNDTMDVSPQTTTRDDGPAVPASGEIDTGVRGQPRTDEEAQQMYRSKKWTEQDLENYAMLKSCSPTLSL